ncbi:unnamed protein product [Ceutorhynchus assimilis]|uniref:Uncharacterized protein n=1 Tax=Ceutorhynchus assimilis TaxID=467358 RepID=A0A9N9QN05_9CUCU|nr:unnamed protein product [Ceutorhynchus assimilis]
MKCLQRKLEYRGPRVEKTEKKHTLTGHSGKVMAAKFLGDASKVVTGSHDRTLKVWDLRSRACIETKFAGSSCNDLVTVDNADTKYLLACVRDDTLKLIDLRMNQVVKNFRSAVTATAWHPYGSYLASVDRSKRAVIWAGDL